MDLEKVYYDCDGNECSILDLVKKEPEWAAERIQVGEAAIREINDGATSQPESAAEARFYRRSIRGLERHYPDCKLLENLKKEAVAKGINIKLGG